MGIEGDVRPGDAGHRDVIGAISRADISGRQVSLAAILLAACVAASAWLAPPLFPVLAIAALGFTAYATHRWPLPTLLVATMAVLADPVLLPSMLPDSIEFGPIGASEPLLAVSGIVIAIDAVRRRAFVPALRDPVFALLLVFTAVALLSAAVNATPPAVALLGIVMTVDAFAVYFIARMLPIDRRGVGVVVTTAVLVSAVVSVTGLLQIILHPDLLGFASFAGRFGEGGRITSFLGNPNMVAAVVGFTIPFPLFGARHLATARLRRIAFGLLVLFGLALLLTFSRGAWLAVGIGAIAGILVFDPRAAFTLVAAFALAWLVSIVMPRNLLIAEADLALYFPGGGEPSIVDSTVDRFNEVYERRDLRMRFIREGLVVVQDNVLLGVGPGRYGGAATSIIASPVYEEYDTGLYGFRTVHNFWLHLLGEVGVLGTAVFLTIVAGLSLRFARAAREARRESDHIAFVLFAGTGTAIAISAMNNATEMIFEGNFPSFVIWLVIGAVSLLAPPGALIRRRRATALHVASSA